MTITPAQDWVKSV